MKILFIINNLCKGGAERFVLDTIQTFNKWNIDYKLAVLYSDNQYPEYNPEILNLTNVEYIPTKLFSKNKNEIYSKLLDDYQPDIIHTNLFLAEYLSAFDVRKNIKYVCHGHDNMHQYKPLTVSELFNKNKLINRINYYFISRNKYQKVDTYFIANSNHTLAYYKKVLPNRQKKNVRLIQYGFNFHKYAIDHVQGDSNKIRLVNIGSYQLKKNHKFIIEIAKELIRFNVNFEINLLGQGSEFDNIASLIRKNNLQDYVFQRGNQSNVQNWLSNSDIYLHTAYYEPFGLVFLEAMAAGLPIITLDGKGNRDIIENDKNGFLFEEQNPKLFAKKIIEYSSNKAKYDTISKYAQEYSKQFDVSIKVKELLDFYKNLLSK